MFFRGAFLLIFLFSFIPAQAQYHLAVNEHGILTWSDTGAVVKIVESNSPENRLLWLDKSQLDILHSAGVNTIYCSLHNSDGNPDLGPWFDYNNPSGGFDQAKIDAW